MASAIRGPKHRDELRLLFEDGSKTLVGVEGVLAEFRPGLLSPEKFYESVSEACPDAKQADAILSSVGYYTTAIDQGDLAIDDIASALHAEFDSAASKASIESLLKIIGNPAVAAAIKTSQLAFDQQSVLQNVKILSDLRPVFNNDRDGLFQFIILNTMQFIARDKYGTKSHAIALDKSDILALKRGCELALKKISALEDVVLKGLKLPVYLPGEDRIKDGKVDGR